MTTAANRQTCVDSLALVQTLCPSLTVADVEDCTNGIGSNLCAFETAPECANYRACFEGVFERTLTLGSGAD